MYLTYEKSYNLIEKLKIYKNNIFIYNKKIIFKDNDFIIFEFNLPYLFPYFKHNNFDEYIKTIEYPSRNIFIALIESGTCVMGYFVDDNLEFYKCIKKYTIRKTQGKAQTTYLKTKGKSRLGSRIRLHQFDNFIQEIVDILSDSLNYFEDINYFFIHSDIRIKSELFKKSFLLQKLKQKEILFDIPFNIKEMSKKEVKKIYNSLTNGKIEFKNYKNERFENYLNILSNLNILKNYKID